jgi:hypothetical protein
MTGKELFNITKLQINIESDSEFPDSQLLATLNSVIIKMNLVVSDFASTTLTIENAKTLYDLLPADLIEVVIILDSFNNPYYDWENINGKITFDRSGTYTLLYSKPFTQLTSTSVNLPFHDLYLPALQAGIKSEFYEREEEMEKSTYFSEQMQGLAGIAFKKLRPMYIPNKIRAVRR